MKIVHISDLHIGKKVCDFSMLELQQNILEQIIKVVDEEKPESIVIAGDIYDKNTPPAQAVTLFDDFLYSLSQRRVHIFIISGNHDSAERLAFGRRIMESSNIHISPVYDGNVTPVTLTDEYGDVSFYMLPFLRPSTVRGFFPEKEIKSYNEAVTAAIDAIDADFTQRNVIISHQFVTGAVVSDSEELSVGGIENVDAAAYDGFDYVALGHIHGPQNIGDEHIRYCGTPLKYSFSETHHKKSVTVAELGEKGSLTVKTVPLTPEVEMREIKGTFEELYNSGGSMDFVHITLTDEQDVNDAMNKLRMIYPRIMKLDYDNKRTRLDAGLAALEVRENGTPLEIFEEFYFQRNNLPMTEEQRSFVSEMINNIWECE